VPGTAASALAADSRRNSTVVDFDASDWWFRCRIPTADVDDGDSSGIAGSADFWTLTLEGLATVADVWCGGRHVLHSENMFVPQVVEVGRPGADDDIVLRFAALTPLLGLRRPRPRWKTLMADHQALRWFRTTYLGRQPGWAETPAPVGPWRPVRLESGAAPRVVSRRVVASIVAADADGRSRTNETGLVSVSIRLAGVDGEAVPDDARLRVRRIGHHGSDIAGDTGSSDGVSTDRSTTDGPLPVHVDGSECVLEGELEVPGIERWWPHSHGGQPRYAVSVEIGDRVVEIGSIGFRTVEIDRTDGAFAVVVNGTAVFCRGACWWPVDPVALHVGDDDLRRTLELVRRGQMNMVRIPGGTVYEDERFWDLCDELGIMVWQDCMIGYTDPPEDDDFEAAVVAELDHVFGLLGGRAALAVLCGGQEIEEQAAMFGLSRGKWNCTLIEKTIPSVAERLLPGVPYVTSSPTGGDLPFQADAGDCHYWGVGSYLRPADDARRSGIRFMSEGMGFAIPPERQTVDEACGGAIRAGHDPGWKQALHHDTGRSWDLEDVRDFYVQQLFGIDPHLLRYIDPERALDMGRAAVAELFGRTLSEWRHPRSPCAGGLLVALRDLSPGAGWGVIDSLGRPKAPWYALARVLAPVALLVTDEGLNGLHLHVMNDTDTPFVGRVQVALFARGEQRVDQAERVVEVPARGWLTVEAGALFDGFRDLSYSYRFGPPAYDVVAADLQDSEGRAVSDVVHLPASLDRPMEVDLGLVAAARPGSDGSWTVTVTTRRFAQWVVVEVPGFLATDSWFHLAPGASRSLGLVPRGEAGRPAGLVRALNARATTRIAVEDGS
jgi:beta-mannosidase